MINATHHDITGQHSDGRPACPSWCEDRDRDDYSCRGDHRGKAWGTVASAGLPPVVDSLEAPSHETVLVRPQWGEDDDLPRAVAVLGSWGGGAATTTRSS